MFLSDWKSGAVPIELRNFLRTSREKGPPGKRAPSAALQGQNLVRFKAILTENVTRLANPCCVSSRLMYYTHIGQDFSQII